jgi:hypothetical protein
MAHVLLASAAPPDDPSWPYPYDELNRLQESAARDRFGVHRVTEDAERADLIVFTDNVGSVRHFLTVRSQALYKQYAHKCFCFSKDDYPIPLLPGVYASLPQRWHRSDHTRSGSYSKAFGHTHISFAPLTESGRHLYSFVGNSTTHPLRERLFSLEHPKQYLEDTAAFWPYGELPERSEQELQDNYRRVSHESSFILAPRGVGASSIRLFESLRMGRAPVIISDDWMPPEGPDWEAFSFRVAEAEVTQIPGLLERHEHRAPEMGRRAREAWENWFSAEATFHRVTEWCLDIQASRSSVPSRPYLKALPQCLSPRYARIVGSTLKRHLFRRRHPSSTAPEVDVRA